LNPASSHPPYTNTPRRPVEDEYHGTKIVDFYRWLESPSDPEVRDWINAQNDYTRRILDSSPLREKLHARLKSLYTERSPDYFSLVYRKGRFFAIKHQPPMNQPILVTMEGLGDEKSEKILVDPNTLDPTGSTAIDFYVPSLDGRYVAVSMSKNGSEQGNAFIYETSSGRRLADEIPRVNNPTGGGSIVWNGNGDGFYYTRYPSSDERPPEDLGFYQQVYFHKLGTLARDDPYVIGKEFPRIAEIRLKTTQDGSYVLAIVANGDGGEFSHYLRGPEGRWSQVTTFADMVSSAELGEDGCLYLLSRKEAPRGRILRLPLSKPELKAAKVLVEQGRASITGFHPTAERLYVVFIDGGPSTLSVYDREGRLLDPVPFEPVSTVDEMTGTEGDSIVFRSESFITPPAWYSYEARWSKTTKTRMHVRSSADFSDCEVVREFAPSKDGTKVPLAIIRRKGTRLGGRNPVLMTGYGGYGVSITPYFRTRRRVWLDEGGIYAVANVRGGGEYGEEWHRAGNLTNKQNVFDDFFACARHLIERKYTSPELLAIEGGSNGGTLMAACITQQPKLFRAVVSRVGVYDMLRSELDANGAFNVTEFGTTKDPAQFRALYAYSPYHHVADGAIYPSILMPAGEHDGRVNPAHTKKMVAALQHATRSGNPVLLRWNSSAGHGIGTALDQQIDEDTDVFTFLFSEIGLGTATKGASR
jgi:prolyl oligopeptidase